MGPAIATQSLNSEFLYAKLLPFLALRHDGPRIPSLFFLIPWFMQLYPTVTVTPRVRKMKHAEPLVSPMSSELFERTPSLGGNSQSSLSDETASPSMEPRRCRIFADSSDCNRRNGVDLCFPQLHKLPARKSTTAFRRKVVYQDSTILGLGCSFPGYPFIDTPHLRHEISDQTTSSCSTLSYRSHHHLR